MKKENETLLRSRWRRRGVRTPTVLQFELAECGAACLKMILSYWGCWIALEELREACGVSRDGSRASNIMKAARNYGLQCVGMRRELHELETISLPCIVHWQFNHFVVLEALFADGVRINDPERGRRKVDLEEFDNAFTGMVLTFTPGPAFERRGAPARTIASLAERLRPARTTVAFAILVSLALAIPALLLPSYTRIFIDDYLIATRDDWLRPTLLAFGITIALQALLMGLQQHHLRRLEIQLTCESSQHFFWSLINLPIGFFAQRLAGDLVNRVDANQRIAQLLAGDVITLTAGLPTAALFAAVMLTYDLELAGIAIVMGMMNLAVMAVIWERLTSYSKRSLQNQNRLAALSMNGLAAIQSMKANNAESAFLDLWAGRQAEFITLQQRLGVVSLSLGTVPALLVGLSSVLVLGFGVYKVVDGSLTVGELVAFQALMIGFNAPLGEMLGVGTKVQQAVADLGRLDDVLEVSKAQSAAEPPDNGASHPSGKLHGLLEFASIRFGYNPLDAPFIENFDLTVRAGSRVAIVGLTGSGKSTIAKLAAGLHRPASGEVRYDGLPIQEIDRRVLADSVAFVAQDIRLFSGTLRDNISLWDGSIDDESIMDAARDACLHEYVSEQSGGYAAGVLEDGRNLSAGERQRLEIARALARRPSVLILDEATAALDPVIEAKIEDNLRRRGCTCLIVAHRLSTVRHCDEIVVMKRGTIVERGTHESLMALDGEYCRLVRGH